MVIDNAVQIVQGIFATMQCSLKVLFDGILKFVISDLCFEIRDDDLRYAFLID